MGSSPGIAVLSWTDLPTGAWISVTEDVVFKRGGIVFSISSLVRQQVFTKLLLLVCSTDAFDLWESSRVFNLSISPCFVDLGFRRAGVLRFFWVTGLGAESGVQLRDTLYLCHHSLEPAHYEGGDHSVQVYCGVVF